MALCEFFGDGLSGWLKRAPPFPYHPAALRICRAVDDGLFEVTSEAGAPHDQGKEIDNA